MIFITLGMLALTGLIFLLFPEDIQLPFYLLNFMFYVSAVLKELRK